ncbi:MAG: hypothetical protein ACLFR1_12840 [Spirochaetia bacterium]
MKVLVLFYSAFGHIYKMAEAALEGAKYQGQHVAKLALKLSS